MTFSTNFSGNRFFLKFYLLAVLLSGCAVVPAVRPMVERVPPPLTIKSVSPDKGPPQAAEMSTVRWQVEAEGGTGERIYSFRLTDGKKERVVQEGPSAAWSWVPTVPGSYRIKAVVRDSLGNGVESGWSPEYAVVPILEVFPVTSDKESPQAAEMGTVRWTAKAAGGVGKRRYSFRLADGKGEKVVQEGASALWSWAPAMAGSYRVKVAVRDAVGNEVENGWSPEYTVVPKLAVSSLSPDKASPQAAEMATVRWTVIAIGGVGERTFAFCVTDGKKERVAQKGPSASWHWTPMAPGLYRVKVVVQDAIGNTVESGWSPDYGVVPKLEVSSIASDKPSPQAARMATIRWKVLATGGVGRYRYEFRTTDGRQERVEQSGELPTWDWTPVVPGTYRVKVVVRDAVGNAVDGGWSSSYVVALPLLVSLLSPDPVSPHVAGTATVRWKVDAAGGVGDRTIEFRTTDGKEEKREQVGPSASWDWSPQVPGTYRVKTVVRDAIGNTVDSGWSGNYLVAAKLRILSLTPDRASPQAAAMSTVRWKVEAEGGVGDREYSFRISRGHAEREEQKGFSPTWDWSPMGPGFYRVRVIVRDAVGNAVDSGWSPEYRIELTAGLDSLIAVMPVENLTGMPVNVHAVQRSLVLDLKRKGLNILGEDSLGKFLERHRVRYTGGLNRELAEGLRKETGANVVLFPFLELFDDSAPPKVALGARLVSTHRAASILWMDSAGISGNDAPGFLLLGLISDPAALLDKARGRVAHSLMDYLSRKTVPKPKTPERRFMPKSFRGVPPKAADDTETLSIAILPFRNESSRRNAGEILALQFLRELSRAGNVDVVEPGEVRQVLLRSRTIMEGGLSLPQAEILRAELEVDLVLTGIVTEYQDAIGGFANPKVEFSVRVFDMNTRQIIWSSSSYNQGDDGVFFFNLGKVNTAHGIAAEMVHSTVREMEAAFHPRESPVAAASQHGGR